VKRGMANAALIANRPSIGEWLNTVTPGYLAQSVFFATPTPFAIRHLFPQPLFAGFSAPPTSGSLTRVQCLLQTWY
jgi:hypothetical protein